MGQPHGIFINFKREMGQTCNDITDNKKIDFVTKHLKDYLFSGTL